MRKRTTEPVFLKMYDYNNSSKSSRMAIQAVEIACKALAQQFFFFYNLKT